MADNREKYVWLVWMGMSSLLGYFYLSFRITIALFLSGLIMISKCLIVDFLRIQNEDYNHNEKNH
jgi:hypothetical protein